MSSLRKHRGNKTYRFTFGGIPIPGAVSAIKGCTVIEPGSTIWETIQATSPAEAIKGIMRFRSTEDRKTLRMYQPRLNAPENSPNPWDIIAKEWIGRHIVSGCSGE